MNFKKREDVVDFLEKSDWNNLNENENAMEKALKGNIDSIFEMVTKDNDLVMMYESGCGSGITTAQICNYLSKKGIKDYKLIASDVNQKLIESAQKRFARDEKVTVELRSGSDYSDIPDETADGIFSFNTIIPFLHMYYTMEKDLSQHEEYLRETSRILKEGKALILTNLNIPLVLVKDSKLVGIPFWVKIYNEHESVEPFLKLLDFVKPINNLDYLEELVNNDYVIEGPRKNPTKDLMGFKRFLKTGREFAPEDWLSSRGYKFVEPNQFTKGHRIAYKLINDFPDERFNSNYNLVKGKRKIPLYLKVESQKKSKL